MASRGIFSLLLFLATSPQAARAQTAIPNLFNPLSASSQGAHFYGVSVFSGYYTGGAAASALGGVAFPVLTPDNPTYDVVTGATASFGWNRTSEKSSISISYSPFYARSISSDHNIFNHSFSGTASRHMSLTRKWSLTFSTTANLSQFQQMLFNPGTLDAAASIPASFDDFAAAVLSGTYTNTQLASILTSTPTPSAPPSPEQTFLYGNRVLSLSAGTNLLYSISQRSSFQIGFSAARAQTLGNSAAPNTSTRYLVPQTTGGSVNMSWSYSLTPRTQISASVVSSRSFSRVQDGYATSANFSIGRTVSRRWFVRGGVGAGMLLFNRHSFPAPGAVQYLVNASLGYKTYAHSFFVSYDRSLGDAYGAGSGSTSSVSATWNWRPPGSGWVVFGKGGWQRLGNPSLNNATSWVGGAGVARALPAHMFMGAQYSYFRFPFAILSQTGLSQEAVSVSLTWSPSYQ